jgi:hypothetical protein
LKQNGRHKRDAHRIRARQGRIESARMAQVARMDAHQRTRVNPTPSTATRFDRGVSTGRPSTGHPINGMSINGTSIMGTSIEGTSIEGTSIDGHAQTRRPTKGSG